MNKIQLWKNTDEQCMLVDYSTDKGSKLISAPNIPVLFWPDGSVCWPVTTWLMDKGKTYLGRVTKKGKRNTKGGSIITDASLISHLIRYTYTAYGKDFTSLNDEDVKGWVNDLKDEVDPKNKKKHANRQNYTKRTELLTLVSRFHALS